MSKSISSRAQKSITSRKRLAGWIFTAILILLASSLPAQAIQRSFLNNGFENIWGPLVGANSNYCWVYDDSEYPWLSNDGPPTPGSVGTGPCNTYNGGSYGSGTNIVEIWFNNFNGVPARTGKVHAELNANSASTLHQNVCVLQNEDITWRLSHRGRDGVDQMQYYIGNAVTGMVLDASTGNTGATAINACQTGTSVTPVSGCTQTTVNTWGDYGGVFKWLGPSAVTSVNFQAISTNGGIGSLTVGNFLDEVYFYLKPVVEFSTSNSSGLESVATPASPKLRVVGALTAPLSVSVSVTGGTAVLGTDYTTPSGTANFTVTIPVGNYVETDSFDTGIQIINDKVANGNRTIIMQVNTNSAYIISSSQTCGQAVNNPATYTIIDDDANLRLIKTTIGGAGNNTFNYTLTNVDTDLVTAGNQTTAIITTTLANPTVEFDANSGAAGTQPIGVATVGADVTVTETLPSGWSVSGSCSVTGGSNPTSSPIAINTGGAVTIPAANVTAGSITTCLYTNTKSLTLTKSFNTATIGVGQTARLTYTITNPAGAPTQTGLNFTDTFPANLVVATSPNVVNNCGGTMPAPSGGATSFVVSSVNAATGASTCTVSVDVTSTTAGSYVNGAGQITAISPLLTNGVTDQTLNVVQTGLTKSFNPTTINPGGTSTLTFTLANGAGNPAQSGINFIDTLPTNVTVAGVPNITTSCPSGTGVVSAAGGVIAVTGASMSGTQASCIITVDVTSNTPGGPYNNTSARIFGLARLTNNVVTSGLTVQGVNLTKSFNTGSIGVGQTATLTFVIENPAGSAQSGLNFTDSLPGSVKVAATPNIQSNCPAGGAFSNNPAFVTAAANSGTITTTGAALNNGVSNCMVRVNVTSNTSGSYINGPTNSSISGLSANLINSVTDQTLNVVPVALTKSYSPSTVDVNASSTLTFTLTNGSGNPAQTTLTFIDTLTAGAGLTVTAVTPLTGTGCSATTPTFNGASPARVTLTNATMAAGATACTFTATVRGNTAATYNNVTANISGASTSINSSGVNSSLAVVAVRPTLTKAFTTPIAEGSTSTLTFTLNNAAGNPAQSAIAFTDTFPAGLTVTAVSGLSVGCTGVTGFSSNTVTLSAGTMALARATCTFTATVMGNAEGTYVNDNTDFSGQTNINTTATTATLLVYAPPVVTKSFGATSIPAGSGYTTMTLTLSNPATNPGNLTNVLVNDIFPLGMTPYTTVGITYGTNTGCTGTTLRDQNGNSLGTTDTGARLTITTVVPGATCQATFNVESSTVGYVTNTTQLPTATTTVGGVALTGATASASINVGSPTLTKSFGTSPIGAGQTSILTFTITNNGTPAQSGLNFTDTLPGNVTVAGTPNIQSNCPAGGAFTNNPAFVTAAAGSGTITTTGAAMNNGVASCQVRVTITSNTAGSYINGPTNSSIAHSSNLIDGVTDQTLVVRQPSLNKAFSPITIDQGGTSTLTFTITNDTGNLAQSGINFTDNLPANVTVAGIPNIQSNCPAGAAFSNNPAFVTAAVGSGTISTTGTGIAMNNGIASCQVKVDVTSNTAGGPYNNTSANISGLSSLTNSVTTSSLTVRAYPVLTKVFSGTAAINVGQTNTLTFTINNNVTNSVARAALAFTDTLPGAGGLTTTATTTCTGGAVTVTGSNVIGFSGGSLNAGATCTVTATVTGVTTGSYINGPTNSSISSLSANLISGVTDQTLTVVSPNLTALKTAFGVTSGANTKATQDIPYVITVTNTGAGMAWEVNVTDAISPYSAYKLNSLAFADGATSSGLTMVNSTTSYSYNNGGTWTTTAPADLGGGYNGTVTNWKIVFDLAVQMNGNNAYFTISYKASVK